MPNPYFSFKKFTIRQDACAMKVCTDACLFGAWAAHVAEVTEKEAALQTGNKPLQHMLDIGSGTGLLSLMLAQKSGACIDAIEIDQRAFGQLTDNIAASPWHYQIRAIHGDAIYFHFNRQYNLVICNPPFYERHLHAVANPKNQARHEAGATVEQLIKAAVTHLEPDGSLLLLLPFFRTAEVVQTAARYGLHLCMQVSVKQTPQHDCFRSMLNFSFKPAITRYNSMYIREDSRYSAAFALLLKDYYLNL